MSCMCVTGGMCPHEAPCKLVMQEQLVSRPEF